MYFENRSDLRLSEHFRDHMHRALIELIMLCLACGATGQTFREEHITAGEAKDHVGERATVCGRVVGIRYTTSSRGQKIFLDLDVKYPKHIFSISTAMHPEFCVPKISVNQLSLDGKRISARRIA